MKLADLMEKSEAGQFAILSFLFQANRVPLRKIIEETGFSKATLLKYVQLANEKASEQDLPILIKETGEWLELELGIGMKARQIRDLFLDTSIKYQILCHLLYKQQFSIQKLAQDLLISEATLNRQLVGLNKSLAEFAISIQNGRLRGEEHQIRYFYYVLFRKIWSGEQLQAELAKPERQQEIQVMEDLCRSQLSRGQTLDLMIWSHITQQRLRVNGCQFHLLEKKMKPYFQTVFYQRILKQTANFFQGKHLTIGLEDSEMMCLFAFLISQHILPLQTMEYILGFGGPVAELTTQLIQNMKKAHLFSDNIEGQVTYELSQLCGQAFIFQGYLLSDQYKYDVQVRLPYLFSDNSYLELVGELLAPLAPFHQGTDLDRKLSWELLQILDYIAENEKHHLCLGLDLLGNAIFFHRVSTTLLRFLEYNQFITVETFQKNKVYDLIISNNPTAHYKQEPVYYLKNDLNLPDLKQIKDLLHS